MRISQSRGIREFWVNILPNNFCEHISFIQPRSDHCLALYYLKSISQSVSPCSCWVLLKLLDLSKLLNRFLWVVTWICPNWYMDFAELLHGFVKFITCILGSVEVVTRICQSWPERQKRKIRDICYFATKVHKWFEMGLNQWEAVVFHTLLFFPTFLHISYLELRRKWVNYSGCT